MADIQRFPLVRHVRSNPSAYVLQYRDGNVTRSGRGLSFWAWPLSDSVIEIPTDDRDLTLVVHGRSSDYQDVTVQGILTYRTADPVRLADRVDFSLDLASGTYVAQPIDRVEVLLSQLAQEEILRYLARTTIRELLSDGIARLRQAVDAALAVAPQLPEFGLAVSSVRITGVRPNPDLEKAIEAPVREHIKQESDEAAFARRAMAVEKERAIAENELQSRIELARREQALIEQQGANAKRKATDEAESAQIAATADAERIETVEGARQRVEANRLAALQQARGSVLATLAATAFAEHINSIENLQITPDLLTSIASAFAQKPSRADA
ncbi:MAG TPA: SPFH domain-containing protein [Xanthomonadales bacterium]|nr:SPFH domain-containing protein [Xanthomonadales bacterium]